MFGRQKQQAKIGAWLGIGGLGLALLNAFLNLSGGLGALAKTLPPFMGLVAGWLLAKDIDTRFILAVLVLLVGGSAMSSMAVVGDVLAKVFQQMAYFFASMMVVPIIMYFYHLLSRNI